MFSPFDPPDDEEPLRTASTMLRSAGFTRQSMRVYCLIGYPRDTFEAAEVRLRLCVKLGFFPMAMLWRDVKNTVDSTWQKFQREWARPGIIYRKCAPANHGSLQNVIQQRKPAMPKAALLAGCA